MTLIVVQLSIPPPMQIDCLTRRAFRPHVLFRQLAQTITQEPCNNYAPNRANTRAGVPDASRISTGKSGLYFFMVGYRESMNSLLDEDDR